LTAADCADGGLANVGGDYPLPALALASPIQPVEVVQYINLKHARTSRGILPAQLWGSLSISVSAQDMTPQKLEHKL
jgi:hypothetical protein